MADREKEMKELYERFSGFSHDADFDIELKSMKTLAFLGMCVAVEYEARKYDDKQKEIYRHEFESPCVLLTNGKDLIIYGDKIKITKRGVEG